MDRRTVLRLLAAAEKKALVATALVAAQRRKLAELRPDTEDYAVASEQLEQLVRSDRILLEEWDRLKRVMH